MDRLSKTDTDVSSTTILEGCREIFGHLHSLMISKEGKKYSSQTIDTAMSMYRVIRK